MLWSQGSRGKAAAEPPQAKLPQLQQAWLWLREEQAQPRRRSREAISPRARACAPAAGGSGSGERRGAEGGLSIVLDFECGGESGCDVISYSICT